MQTTKNFKEVIFEKIQEWKEGHIPVGASLLGLEENIFHNPFVIEFPSTLSSAQRKHVHAAAMTLNLYHTSKGLGASRYIRVSRTEIVEDSQDLADRSTNRPSSTLWYNEFVTKPAVVSWFSATEQKSESENRPKSLSHASSAVEYVEKLISDYNISDDSKQGRTLFPKLETLKTDFVDTLPALHDCVDILWKCSEIAFDTEAHHYRYAK